MSGDIRAFLNLDRLLGDIRTLAGFGAVEAGGIDRPAFSPAIVDAEEWLMQAMRQASMTAHRDGAGNIIGRLGPQTGRTLICGSHIDTVRGGGSLDGTLGVLAGLECARAIAASGLQPSAGFEVVAFADEEGAYHGLLGSKAMAGALEPADIQDSGTLAMAMLAVGLDFSAVSKAARKLDEVEAYLELHIEQGPVLERLGLDIGIVDAIVGMDLSSYTLTGKARHSGSTPMADRQDALVCAASAIHSAIAAMVEEGLADAGTMTFGNLRVSPGSTNVVPGQVIVDSEVRAQDRETIAALRSIVDRAFRYAAGQAGLTTVRGRNVIDPPAPLSKGLRDRLFAIAAKNNLQCALLSSGACHDAQVFASRDVPTAMIFIESKGGISHHSDEHSTPAAIRAGAEFLLLAVHDLLVRGTR
ncbi:MAG: Zn-dependent hydrolase [Mesorhizobium sp.]|nr:MAG: Zn-dependent hydrolase [Mesorhizobium sp.]